MTGLASFGGPATPHIKEKRQRQPDSLSLRTVPRKSNDPSNTAGFLLSKIGKAATERFAEKIAPLGLRPKHCGVLALSPLSQQELARILDLVPSAIVTIVDELKALNAVERVEDPSDRRRYTIELTQRGEALLRSVTVSAIEVDAEIMAALTKGERAAFVKSLKAIALTVGLIPQDSGKAL
jgi:DNA-binding MarR family transcriptional regulator